LGALTTLAALAGGGLATLPAEASGPAAPATRTVEVAYGDGPVAQTSWDEPIDLVFRGEKGDRVSVVTSLKPDGCDTGEDLVLTGRDGEVPQPESLFYRLPASGRYTFSYRQDCWDSTNDEHNPTLRYPARLQLVKLRVKDATAREEVSIPFQTGYVAAVRIALQRHERPLEIPALEWDDLITPYATRTTIAGAGTPIQDWYHGYGTKIVLKKGARVPGFNVSHSRVRYGKPFVFYRIDAGITLTLRHVRS
ncbi:hypothetical protein Q9S36_25450, partial [Microbacterium sp. ARD31]|uniref:hypothetical protein n=1 Tax=Microbacterium sp. ARD31 TaxID=2962576 RepID=UPI00288281B6